MNDRNVVVVLAAAIAVALAAACLVGSIPLGSSRVLAALMGGASAGDRVVVWEIRLPRAVSALVVGAALGASGAALQGLLRNPLAEPGVLGVSATAALGATFVLYYGLANASAVALPVAAIAGALTATALLTVAGRAGGLGGDAHPGGGRAVEFRRRRDGVADEPGAASVFPVRHAELDARHRRQPELRRPRARRALPGGGSGDPVRRTAQPFGLDPGARRRPRAWGSICPGPGA